jgi:Fe-S cluster assembly ATP-binding protein
MTDTMLSISKLSVSVSDKPILKGLTLDIPAGQVHAIMGPNGAVSCYSGHSGDRR